MTLRHPEEYQSRTSPEPPRSISPGSRDVRRAPEIGAVPPRFPYKARPLTAVPRPRLPQSGSRPTSSRAMTSLQTGMQATRRPTTAQIFRDEPPRSPSRQTAHRPLTASQKRQSPSSEDESFLLHPDLLRDDGVSPWNTEPSLSALPGGPITPNSAPAGLRLHASPTQDPSPPRTRPKLEIRAQKSAPWESFTGYPVGMSPVNKRMTALERVRIENAWLREQFNELRQEIATETKISQYRLQSHGKEKEELQKKLAQTEQAVEQARKTAAENLTVAKRREGLVHRIRDEEQHRTLLRERIVRRLIATELDGAKGSGMADWKLFFYGIGDYFAVWHSSVRRERIIRAGFSGEKDNEADTGDASPEDVNSIVYRPLSSQRRSVVKTFKRLHQQQGFLLRQERRSASPELSRNFLDQMHRWHSSFDLEGAHAQADAFEGRSDNNSFAILPHVMSEDRRRARLEGERGRRAVSGNSATNSVEQTPDLASTDGHSNTQHAQHMSSSSVDATRSESQDRSQIRAEIRRQILSRHEGSKDLTGRESDFLRVATDEICKRMSMERAHEQEREGMRMQYKHLLQQVTAALDIANQL